MYKRPDKKDLIVFELIWALIFITIALYPLSTLDSLPTVEQAYQLTRQWALYLTLFFLAVAATYPRLLSWFYRIWVAFGEFVGAIVSKIILFLLFFLLFTPIALGLRILRKDLLHKKLNKTAGTYWIDRDTQPGPLKNQF